MSVYIKGMEMPKNCFLCKLSYLSENRLFCYQTKDEVLRAKIADNCPLIPVPDHGRLIDADVLLQECQRDEAYGYLSAFEIDNAPTIIPADKEKRQ